MNYSINMILKIVVSFFYKVTTKHWNNFIFIFKHNYHYIKNTHGS